MLTAMRNVPLRRLVTALTSGLVIFAAFTAGIGIYAAALAYRPLLLVWWPWLVAGVVGVVALGAWWLWWRLPKRQVERVRLMIRDSKARADVEDNFRKTIGQLLGGAAVLIGAAFAYLQFQQQQRSSHDVLISNQVAKGFELLGNKDKEPMQRMGGIYALEGVMNNSEDYHQPVLETLSAFVREKTQTETGEGRPTDDIQAALTVIGRRKEGVGTEEPVDLSNAHISIARLYRARLSGATLAGAILTGANLRYADLRHATLSSAILTSANLTDANLRYAILYGADLTSAYLLTALLSDADLRYATLSGANLSGANLTGAKLGNANLTGAILTGAILTGANLTGANLTNPQSLTKEQLDKACGTGVRGLDKLSPPLAIKPCP
jgi:uncharacterized protein YjbI with pentapeptide repeats